MRWVTLFGTALLTLHSAYAAYRISDDNQNQIYAEVDYLAWFAQQEGLSFATRTDADYNSNLQVYSLDETDLFFANRFDSGIRAAMGYKPCNRSWETRLIYNFFKTRSSPKSTQTTFTPPSTAGGDFDGTLLAPDYLGILLTNPLSPFTGADALYGISSHWSLHFNELDLEMGCEYAMNCDTLLRPFIGMRGLFVNQLYGLNLIVLTSSINPLNAVSYLKQQNNFNGFGPRTGVDLTYTLGWGFDFYGTLGVGILWGYFNCHQSYYCPSNTFNQEINLQESFNHSHHSTVFSADASFGITWNCAFNYSREHLTLRLGWEEHLFSNINQFQEFLLPSTTDNSSFKFTHPPTVINANRNVQRGDLSLSGFVAGFSYCY